MSFFYERKINFMAQHIIPITKGKKSKALANGNNDATAIVEGYDSSTLISANQEITEGENTYSFTIGATGTLTLHVSDDYNTLKEVSSINS